MNILQHINWVDILVIIIVTRMSYVAFREGFTHEIFPLIGTTFVMVFSLHYYGKFGEIISRELFNASIQFANFASFVMIAVVLTTICKLLNTLLNKILKMQWNPIIEKFGGLILGVVRASITASLILTVLSLTPLPYFQWSIRDKSLTGVYVLGIGPSIYERVSCYLPTIRPGGTQASKTGVMNNLMSDKAISANAKKETNASPRK